MFLEFRSQRPSRECTRHPRKFRDTKGADTRPRQIGDLVNAYAVRERLIFSLAFERVRRQFGANSGDFRRELESCSQPTAWLEFLTQTIDL